MQTSSLHPRSHWGKYAAFPDMLVSLMIWSSESLRRVSARPVGPPSAAPRRDPSRIVIFIIIIVSLSLLSLSLLLLLLLLLSLVVVVVGRFLPPKVCQNHMILYSVIKQLKGSVMVFQLD